jgi:hypothetical protein
VAQRPDGKAAKTQAPSFTRPAAERIAKVVRKVEAGDRKENALSFERVGGGGGAGGGKVFRMATFTASWDKGSSRTVTFLNQTNTPNTATAINLFADVNVATSATAHCAIAKDGTAWYLIAAECDAGDEEE